MGAAMTAARPTPIVILGGGFGGVYTALELERRLGRDPRVEVSLVSRENYLVFQPMLPEVISGSIGILDTITPIRRLCPRTTLYTRAVESIDLERKRVTAPVGFGSRQSHLEYDRRGRGILRRGGRGRAERFRPVRGRLVPHHPREELRVILLHAGSLILPELPQSLAAFAQRLLAKRGVELRLNVRLHGATADAALLEDGERIPTNTVVSTVPSGPNTVVTALPCRKEKGRILVTESLDLPDHPGVWAVGDCAFVLDGETGQPCPPTAQHAIRQARCVARNIVATLRGEPRRRFAFKALGKMGALGHRSAVAEVFGIRLSGFLAWWLWRTVYLMKLPGLDRKLRVATDWTLDLLLPPDIVQLKTDRGFTIRREHYESGEIIFREGDRGDWLYIVVDGEVEVVRGVPGQDERALRRLGPGECFGEIALVSDSPRTATVRSVTSVNLLAVDRDAFQALFGNLPPLRSFFEGLIAQRLTPRAE